MDHIFKWNIDPNFILKINHLQDGLDTNLVNIKITLFLTNGVRACRKKICIFIFINEIKFFAVEKLETYPLFKPKYAKVS